MAAPVGPRDLAYIRSSGRRLSEYEATSCSIQTNTDGYDGPGWFNAYPDGRGAWSATSTRLRSSDWFAFRDPAQMWQRTYIRRQCDQERAIEHVTRHAADTGLLGKMEPEWSREVIGDIYLPFAFLEDALLRVFTYAQREALCDTLAGACIFNATDKARHAQDIILYHLELGDAGVPIREDDAKTLWMEAPELQGVRRLAEGLLAAEDWAEIAIAVNLVVEPLITATVMNDVILAGAGAHGDVVTPLLLIEADRDRQRNAGWTLAMVRMLVEDESFGDENRAVISEWLTTWSIEAIAALEALDGWGKWAGRAPGELCDLALQRSRQQLAGLGLDGQSDRGGVMGGPEPRQSVSICLMKGEDAEAAVESVQELQPHVSAVDEGTFWVLQSPTEIVLDVVDIGERLGRDLPVHEFLVSFASYSGRAEVDGDLIRVTSDMLQLS